MSRMLIAKNFFLKCFRVGAIFFYNGKHYTYVPLEVDSPGFRVVGLIGRPHEETVNGPPENLFAPQRSKYYRAAAVVCDLSKNMQVVAMQFRPEVGSPERLIVSMADSFVKERKGFSWHVDVAYISYKKEFWQAVEKHSGDITELRFEFFPPNGVFGFERWKEFNKKLLDQNNGDRSEYALKNDEGNLRPQGDFVRDAVEYASQGPGTVLMKSGRRILYSSTSERQKAEIPDDLLPTSVNERPPMGLWDFVFSRLER